MANVAGVTHDISIKVGSGAETGLTLARREGVKQYQQSAIDYFPPGFVTTAPAPENVNPRLSMPLTWLDGRGGFGEDFKAQDARYHHTDAAYAGDKGKVQLGGRFVQEFRGPITNPNFDADLSGWTVGGGTAWTPGGKAQFPAVIGGPHTLAQGIAFAAADRGKPVCIVFDLVLGGATMTVTLADGVKTVTRTFVGPVTAAGSIGTIISSGAGGGVLTLTFSWPSGSGAVATVDTVAYWVPSVAARAIGQTWVASGTMLHKWDAADGWVRTYTAGAVIKDLHAYGDALFLAFGNATNGEYTTNGTVFNAIGGAGINSDFMSTQGTNLWFWQNLAAPSNPNGAFSTTPANAKAGILAGGTVDVGSVLEPITGTVDTDDVAMVWKTNGLWSYNPTSGTFSQFATELASLTHATTGYASRVWKGSVYAGVGGSRVYRVTEGVVEGVSPKDAAVDQSEYGGTAMAMESDADWLYNVQVYGGSAYLLAGADWEGAWRWHTLRSWASAGVTDAIIDRATFDKLFVLTSEGAPYFYINRLQAGFKTESTGYWWGPREDAGFRTWDKEFQSLDVIATSLGTGKTLTVYYAKASDPTTWTLLGTVTANETTKLVFSGANSPVDKWIQVKVVLNGSDVLWPVFCGYVVNCLLKPQRRRAFQFSVAIARAGRRLDGVIEKVDPGARIAFCESVDEAAWPVEFRDPFDRLFYLDFDAVKATKLSDTPDTDASPEYVAEFRGVEADI